MLKSGKYDMERILRHYSLRYFQSMDMYLLAQVEQ